MAIKMIIDGIEVSVSDPAEAAALLKALKEQPDPKPAKTKQPSNGRQSNVHGFPLSGNEHIDVDIASKAIRMLKLLQSSKRPLPTSEVIEALGVSSPNAVGGTTKKINSMLADLGFRKNMVYRNPKKTRQPRTWSSGRNIGQAINALEQSIESQK